MNKAIEQNTAYRQSKALLGIRESVKNYASIYNHYIRVDRWDKACPIMHMIDNLGYAIPFIDESLRMNVILDSDSEFIKEINISCDGNVVGMPWVVYEGMPWCGILGDEQEEI